APMLHLAPVNPSGDQPIIAPPADSHVTPATHESPETNFAPATRSPVASRLRKFVQNMRMVLLESVRPC
ncbi:MAG: hypothetical protein KDA99_25430, partial [Planctomycetales bacterium]|nr:hypothetical protein [Planctomycetales bacterium]